MHTIDRDLLERYDRPGRIHLVSDRTGVEGLVRAARLRAAPRHRRSAGRRAALALRAHPLLREPVLVRLQHRDHAGHRQGRSLRRHGLAEADLVARHLGSTDRKVVQHHWNGGTPTFLPPDECRRLFVGLCERFPLKQAQRSASRSTRVTTKAYRGARRSGLQDMGVQDFDPKVQEAIRGCSRSRPPKR